MREAATREDATEKSAVTPGPLAPARELLGDMLMELKRPAEAQRGVSRDAAEGAEPSARTTSQRQANVARLGPVHTGLYVMMGVCGSGKSLIGATLARALGIEFVEGDDFHPPENVRRMAAGIPLTDADRPDWLLAIAERLREAKHAGVGLVVSCSALKRTYRDLLRPLGTRRFASFISREPSADRRACRRPPRALHAGVAARQPARHSRRAGAGRARVGV